MASHSTQASKAADRGVPVRHTGPPCLASNADAHGDVRCTRDKGHTGDHEADDGEVVVTRWAPARFAPEVVAWARSVLASAVSGTRNDESAPTDAATSTGASPTPSEARSKTMSSIANFPAAPSWVNEETIVKTYGGEYMPDGTVSAHPFTTFERRTITLPGVANFDGPHTGEFGLSDLTVGVGTIITEGEEVFIPGVFVGLDGRDHESIYFDAESARKAAAALLEAADILEGVQR